MSCCDRHGSALHMMVCGSMAASRKNLHASMMASPPNGKAWE